MYYSLKPQLERLWQIFRGYEQNSFLNKNDGTETHLQANCSFPAHWDGPDVSQSDFQLLWEILASFDYYPAVGSKNDTQNRSQNLSTGPVRFSLANRRVALYSSSSRLSSTSNYFVRLIATIRTFSAPGSLLNGKTRWIKIEIGHNPNFLLPWPPIGISSILFQRNLWQCLLISKPSV